MKRKLFAYENLMGNHDKILKVEKVAAWKKRSDIQQKQVTSQLSTININLGSTVQFCQVLSLCKGSLLSSCLAQNTGCSAHTEQPAPMLWDHSAGGLAVSSGGREFSVVTIETKPGFTCYEISLKEGLHC